MKKPRTCLIRIAAVGVILCVAVLAGCANAQWDIQNPYAGVDWNRHRQYKANLHTHTTMSDGEAEPGAVIDRYAELGYAILALTDHDTMVPATGSNESGRHRTTWPWEAFDRDPEALGMLAVEGNEISRVHHIGSYFNDYGDPDVLSADVALGEIGRRGGLAVLFHPGRYDKPVKWYADRYRAHPGLVGIEIFNQGDRYPNDRDRWDSILVAVIDERPVWGFSNDDMHDPATQLGRSWNIMLLPELSTEWVRRAMETGRFLYCHAPHGHEGPAPPRIESVKVDSRRGVIHIQATGHERIEWISGGALVQRGDSIELSKSPGIEGYVRAVVYARDGVSLVGTQPFRVRHRAK